MQKDSMTCISWSRSFQNNLLFNHLCQNLCQSRIFILVIFINIFKIPSTYTTLSFTIKKKLPLNAFSYSYLPGSRPAGPPFKKLIPSCIRRAGFLISLTYIDYICLPEYFLTRWNCQTFHNKLYLRHSDPVCSRNRRF